MTDDRRGLSRRELLMLSAVGGLGAMGLTSALDADGHSGQLTAGSMALSQAFNVAQDFWIGPNSAKSNVTADSGRVYWASDTGGVFYGDGGAWVKFDADLASLTTDDLDTVQTLKHPEHVVLRSEDGDEVFRLASRTSTGSTYSSLKAAIDDALNTLAGKTGSAARHGELRLPYGVFDVDETIALDVSRFDPGMLKVIGGGFFIDGSNSTNERSGTVLNSKITDGSIVFTTGDGTNDGADPTEHLEVYGIAVNGNKPDDGDGIVFTGADESKLAYSGSFQVGGDGVVNWAPQGSVWENVTVRKVGGLGIFNRGNLHGLNLEVDFGSGNGTCFRNKGKATLIDCDFEQATGGSDPTIFDKDGRLIIRKSTLAGGSTSFWDDGGGNRIIRCNFKNFDSYGYRKRNTGIGEVSAVTQIIGCKGRANTGATANLRFNGKEVAVKNFHRDTRDATVSYFETTTSALDISWPTLDTFNGAIGASPSSGTLTLSFDAPFTQKPKLEIVIEGEAHWHVSSWSTDGNGNYDGATLTFTAADGTAANPTTHWKAEPRNVAV